MDIVVYIQFFILLLAVILVTYGYVDYTYHRDMKQKKRNRFIRTNHW